MVVQLFHGATRYTPRSGSTCSSPLARRVLHDNAVASYGL
jgi:hypothetical protein